jgi:hypothetical protein
MASLLGMSQKVVGERNMKIIWPDKRTLSWP